MFESLEKAFPAVAPSEWRSVEEQIQKETRILMEVLMEVLMKVLTEVPVWMSWGLTV